MKAKRIVVAMSGGVDSSVSAHLLVEQGYDVVGLFLRTGARDEEDDSNPLKIAKVRGCCSAIDAADAQRVADRLEIPFYALNFEDDFLRIKDYFAEEYSRGRTPNPCVVCNTWLKFGRLWDYAKAVGADAIATGHYARIIPGAPAELHRAVDPAKDQSYFLFGLDREVLDRVLFPVGGMAKSLVRAIAERMDLGVSHKPDSQEICFVPGGDYVEFLERHRPSGGAEGEIVDETGRVVGRHRGIRRFTIGQRKGLGVALGEPRYVLELDARENRVVIGPRDRLSRLELRAEKVHWLLPAAPAGPFRCTAKIRHLHEPAAATLQAGENGEVLVRFDEPQQAITPGQAVVFYDGTRVLGGGWIR